MGAALERAAAPPNARAQVKGLVHRRSSGAKSNRPTHVWGEKRRRTPQPDATEASLIQPIQEHEWNNPVCLFDSCAKNSQDSNIWEDELKNVP